MDMEKQLKKGFKKSYIEERNLWRPKPKVFQLSNGRNICVKPLKSIDKWVNQMFEKSEM